MMVVWAIAAAVAATATERVTAWKDHVPTGPVTSAVTFLMTTGSALLFQIYADLVFGANGTAALILSAVLGAVIARIAVSDARMSMVPDGLCIPGFALLVVWRWSVHHGAVPDAGTTALLAAAGVAVFLVCLALFVVVPAFRIPPVDVLLFLMMLTVPPYFDWLPVEGGILLACLIMRRAFPGLGLMFMTEGRLEMMREEAAVVFEDDLSEEPDTTKYFPFAPFAAVSVFGTVAASIIVLGG